MTKGRRCRENERLILEREDRPLEEREAQSVADHLAKCAGCRQFETLRRSMKNGVKALPWPRLPDALDQRTRQRVREERLERAGGGERPAPGRERIPVPVTVALVLVTALTVAWLTLSLVGLGPIESLKSLEELPLVTRIALALIVQGAAVLLCAPIIMRAARAAQNENEDIG